MRGFLGIALLVVAIGAHASGGTLRVGSQVLVVGDSASRVIELLGKPNYKGHGAGGARKSGKKHRTNAAESSGEQWQYRQGSRTVTVVVMDGRVAAIRDGGR
ncbi:DUF2845 domain-containing protein [Dyella solisilvae]|uniref:DUF2845 domain-containing protein n=1 Tax=Dyella solisilvae TaxID=1920168 RepID=A0A370K7C7_9GAMM|nr:DUF2845 domain-containing protein [Dyella solisilvae]RDI98561.1 DUF2845 domain-containing protein [Dyella solisilvae]